MIDFKLIIKKNIFKIFQATFRVGVVPGRDIVGRERGRGQSSEVVELQQLQALLLRFLPHPRQGSLYLTVTNINHKYGVCELVKQNCPFVFYTVDCLSFSLLSQALPS